MGNCFCIPQKPLATENEGLKFVKTKEIVISPNSKNPKNQTPKNENKGINGTESPNNGINKSTKVENSNGNNEEEEEDIRDVSQIFIKEENEILDLEDMKNQAKINLEDFKLLKVFSSKKNTKHNNTYIK